MPKGFKLKASYRTKAMEAARAGGRVLLRHFGKSLNVRHKSNASLVTNADLSSERAILKILKGVDPSFGLISEESAPLERIHDEVQWIVDPLDGTTNFVHGFPFFCVSIALAVRGEVVLGVIYHPSAKDLYVAQRGWGAKLNNKRMKVSPVKQLKDSLLATGLAFEPRGSRSSRILSWLRKEVRALEAISSGSQAIRRPGSAALDMAYVARGVFDGFWERGLPCWDVAAGSILIEEAGGLVTGLKGQEFDILSREVLASNTRIHNELQSRLGLRRR